MAAVKRSFRTEQSYAFERVARDAVAPLLRSRGVVVHEDQRRAVGPGQSQLIRTTLPDGVSAVIRVRLCWRRDGRSAKENLFSAAQLAAHTLDGDWAATLEHMAQRDRDAGITHTLLFQRDAHADVYAALVPTDAMPRIWRRQYEVSAELIGQDKLGRMRKNHAANGDSPTIWLQDDRAPDAHLVPDVLWSWPGVINVIALPMDERMPGRAKYWKVLDALQEIGRPASVAEVRAWLEANASAADYSDTRENLTLLTVNDANRRHYDLSRRSFRSDQGHPRDAVIRSNEGRQVRYEPYDAVQHGVFDVIPGPAGGFEVVRIAPGDLAQAVVSAQQTVEAENESIRSLEDARSKTMRAIVERRGQREFRDSLLRAYGNRCAITDCNVLQVLEAAHIVPYLGDHTQRTDNGLLLRADLHTLFDLGKVWIDDAMKVRLSSELAESDYGSLDGRVLNLPRERRDHPHPDHLAQHRKACGKR